MATGGKLARSQTDASDALYDYPCNPCAKDGKNMEAIFQCMDCQMFYCSTCVSGHNKFTENHNTIEKTSKLFGQGQRQPRSFSSSELPTDLCEEHHGEVIKMFCGQHDLVCCTVCVAVKHRSCEGVEYIPNIVRGLLQKQDKESTKASLERVKDDLQNLKSKMQAEVTALHKQRNDILADIQALKERLIDRVEKLEQNTVKEVQDTHCRITADIHTCSKKIDSMMTDIQLRLDKLKYSETDNAAQTFVDIKDGEKQVSDGNHCTKQYLSKTFENLSFEVNREIEISLNEGLSLGTVTVLTKEIFLGAGNGPFGTPVNRNDPIRTQGAANSPLKTPVKQSGPFGTPAKLNGPFGTPVKPSGLFGTPPKPSSPFGTPAKPSGPFGTPVKPSGPFGTPVKPSGPFGTPIKPSGPFGTSVKPSGPFGTPAEPSSPF